MLQVCPASLFLQHAASLPIPEQRSFNTLPACPDMAIPTGSCVLAIVMLAALSPGELPGVPVARYRDTDIASFHGLWEGAKTVQAECVDVDGVGGSDSRMVGKVSNTTIAMREGGVEAGWIAEGELALPRPISRRLAS